LVLEDAQAKQTQEVDLLPYVKEGGTNVHVKWVPSDLTDEQLTDVFAHFGTVKRFGGAQYLRLDSG
jgi:hypothetical protein